MPRIIGIDPSLTSTGVAVVSRSSAGNDWAAYTFLAKSKPGDGSWTTQHQRIRDITKSVIAELDRMPTLVSMEAPAFSRVTGHQHDRSGLWWSIYTACVDRGLPVITPTTNQRMQYATGKGNAQKDMVLAAAIKRWPEVDIIGNDDADALILAAIGARVLGLPIDSVPPSHYISSDKVKGNWIEKLAA